MAKKAEPWKTVDWFVSHYNYSKGARRGLKLPKKVRVHDITLRDGEQQAGIVIRKEEKIQVARALSEAEKVKTTAEAKKRTLTQEEFLEIVRSTS